jgi:hypothetical protein
MTKLTLEIPDELSMLYLTGYPAQNAFRVEYCCGEIRPWYRGQGATPQEALDNARPIGESRTQPTGSVAPKTLRALPDLDLDL